jgi:hypothetical protein
MKKLEDFLHDERDDSVNNRTVLASTYKSEEEIGSMNAFTFAHMADCHLGAFREEYLRELNLRAFERSIDICIERRTDFIVISGDLFHRSFPDLAVVKRAVKKMREAVDAGIRIYLIYGSHDYTANTTSLIDVIGSTGLFKKVFIVDSEAHLDPVIDKETGAELMGISGRTQALEREYYSAISAIPKGRFNIFLFHTAISELRPDYIPQEDSIPQSALPPGFDYYAGGHLHERLNKDNIYYPGPLFGADFRDLSARKDRGFYLVHVDGKLAETEFMTVSDAQFSLIDLDFSGIDSKKASELLKQKCSGNFSGIVLLNLHGKLSGGSVADIEVNAAKKAIESGGAEFVVVSRNITTGEKPTIAVSGNNREEIESRLFTEMFGKDTERARALFTELAIDPEEMNMSKHDFEETVASRGLRFFGLEGSDDN